MLDLSKLRLVPTAEVLVEGYLVWAGDLGGCSRRGGRCAAGGIRPALQSDPPIPHQRPSSTESGGGVTAVLGLLDRIANRGAHDSSPLSEEEVRAELISIYPELSSALLLASSSSSSVSKMSDGKVVTAWFHSLAEWNKGKEGIRNWQYNWELFSRESETFWREVFENLRGMRYPDFLKLYIGPNGTPPGLTNPTKSVMDNGLSEILNFFEAQRGEKRDTREESAGKRRRPLGEGEPTVGQARRTGEEVGMSGVTAMHANADSMAQQGDLKPEADRPPGVSSVAMPADDRPVVVTDAPIQVTPEMPGQQQDAVAAKLQQPRQMFASLDEFRAFVRKTMQEGKLGDNSVQVGKDLLNDMDQIKRELPEVRDEFAKLVYQTEYFPEVMSPTQVFAWIEKQPGAATASMSAKIKLLTALIDGEPGSPFGAALIPNVERAFDEARTQLIDKARVKRPISVEEVSEAAGSPEPSKRADTRDRMETPVITEPLLSPITEKKTNNTELPDRARFNRLITGPSDPKNSRLSKQAAVDFLLEWQKKEDSAVVRKAIEEWRAAAGSTKKGGRGRKKSKDGLDVGSKKKATAAKKKPDPNSSATILAKEIQAESVSNPERRNPGPAAVDRAVKAVMATDHPNLNWDRLTGNRAGKQEYLRLSANVRRLITGQGKKPHEYAMLGHHWSVNKEGEVHRNCHRLEEYRKPGHPVGGIHMAELPKTAAEAREAQIRTLFGEGGDHRIWSAGQRAAYERVKQREYNDWPLSTNYTTLEDGSKVPGRPIVTDRAKSAAWQEAYRHRYQRDWVSFQQRVALGRRPDLYKEPRGVTAGGARMEE